MRIFTSLRYLILSLTLLICLASFGSALYTGECWHYTNGTFCLNGSTSTIKMEGAYLEYAYLLNVPAVTNASVPNSSYACTSTDKLSNVSIINSLITGICTADSGGGGSSDGTGGWTNTTTYTQTLLNVNITGRLNVTGQVTASNITLQNNCATGDVLKWSNGVGTCGSDSGDGNNYPTSLDFVGAILTLGRNGLSSLTATIPNNSISLSFFNITGQFNNAQVGLASINNQSLNTTNTGTAGQVLTLGANSQFTWATASAGGISNFQFNVSNGTTSTQVNNNTRINITAGAGVRIQLTGTDYVIINTITDTDTNVTSISYSGRTLSLVQPSGTLTANLIDDSILLNFLNISGRFNNAQVGLASINNQSLNTTNTGTAGQVLTLGANSQFTWATASAGGGGGNVTSLGTAGYIPVFYNNTQINNSVIYQQSLFQINISANTSIGTGINYDFNFNTTDALFQVRGEINVTSLPTATGVVCVKTDGNFGQCTSVVGVTGLCTCG